MDGIGKRDGPGGGDEVIDVDLLVADIRRRAAAMRERGAYPVDLLGATFDLGADGSAPLGSPITLRPERGYSSKAVVGPGITAAKRVAEKLVHHVVQDGLDQASIRIEHLSRTLEDAERRTEERLDDLARSLGAAEERTTARLEQLRGDVAGLRARLEEFEVALERIGRHLDDLEERRPSES